MSHSEERPKKGINSTKMPYKPVIKNFNFNFERQFNYPYLDTYQGLPKMPQKETKNRNRNYSDLHNGKAQNLFISDYTKVDDHITSDIELRTQHKRMISIFKTRIKKNQMFLPRKQQAENSNMDSFMFSFYNPKMKQKPKRPDENLVAKGNSMTYDIGYISNQQAVS